MPLNSQAHLRTGSWIPVGKIKISLFSKKDYKEIAQIVTSGFLLAVRLWVISIP